MGGGVAPTAFPPQVWGVPAASATACVSPLVVLAVLWACSGCSAGLVPQTDLQMLPWLRCAGPLPRLWNCLPLNVQ